MFTNYIEEIVDIFSIEDLPNNQYKVTEQLTVVLGDLHGNAIKLLYCLMLHGFIDVFTPQTYFKLIRTYITPTAQLTPDDIQEFNAILAKASLKTKGRLILIGDVLADRGSNDYWTLKVLELLSRLGISVEILLSNHDSTFIEATELQKDYQPPHPNQFNASMVNLQKLIKMKLVDIKEVNALAQQIYKPMLKALSYSLATDQKSVTLYSHAAIGLNTIKTIAAVLELKYSDATPMALCKSIDAINAEFRTFVQNKQVYELYREVAEDENNSNPQADLSVYPFAFLMYNRLYHHIQRPKKHGQKDYGLNYVHGHDSDDPEFAHLNNTLGMSLTNSGGLYTAIITDGTSNSSLRNNELNQQIHSKPTLFSYTSKPVDVSEKMKQMKQSLVSSGYGFK